MLALESNPATLQKIGERGREHVVLRYPEQLTLEAHDELYRRLLADR